MARLSTAEPEVRALSEKLVPLVLQAGSVNKVCEQLNRALARGGIQSPLYPNRLHTLLSDDPLRFVNEATLHLAQRAMDLLVANPSSRVDGAKSESLAGQVISRWRTSPHSPTTTQEISDALGLPPAVIRYILEGAGEVLRVASGSPEPVPFREFLPSAAAAPQGAPDWSFQDVAVERCLRALLSALGRKVGLVLPTGAGKTRIALRIALSVLALASSAAAVVLWVTHRKMLYSQAHRELQKMVSRGIKDLPPNAIELLAKRVRFVMVSDLAEEITRSQVPPALVVVDEAHHAAAASYAPIFESAVPLSGLFLTATPNRTDDLPIGIDEIAFTETYRELAERGVIVLPEFEDFPVPDFAWSEENLRDLADKVITRAADDYTKVLVLAPRINRVEEFYAALQERLALDPNHPLTEEDIGFIHSVGNSLRILNAEGDLVRASGDEFLNHFALKPRAIMVSAQMLLEGFDDPEINTVVITYPSNSLIVLMQAAGRCVRHTPSKTKAIVLQARNDSLAYHFDQRWLYQEISDFLRPQLVDIDYQDMTGLKDELEACLTQHRVSGAIQRRILASVEELAPGERCRLLLAGLPYYGKTERFESDARWSAVLETPGSSDQVRDLFNTFSALGAELSDPGDFLRKHGARFALTTDFREGSAWRQYNDMFSAMYFAQKELYGEGSNGPQGAGRPFRVHGATTWLKYVSFNYRPSVSPELSDFLRDCLNRDHLVSRYQQRPLQYGMVLKLPLPLNGCEGHLLTLEQAEILSGIVRGARELLAQTEPGKQFATLAAHIASTPAVAIPISVLTRLERYVSEQSYRSLVFNLQSPVGARTSS